MRRLADAEKVGKRLKVRVSICWEWGAPAPAGRSALSFGGGDPRITAEMGQSWSVCVPVKTLCVQEVSLGGFWAVGGAALDFGGDLGVSRVSPAESQLPGPLGQRGGTVSTGSQEVAPQAGVSLTVMGKSDCGRG